MSENKNLIHNSKKNFLKNPVEHIDITSFDARKIISSMEKMSFVSRETANAANIFNEMILDKECTIFLTLAGSTSAAGCMNIYKDLVKYNMVDAIVATGASIVDMDFFEALGFKHYQGSQFQDDTELRKNYIDRIYDTYIDEEELQECDKKICVIADTLDPRSYTSREFISEMGIYLKQHSKIEKVYWPGFESHPNHQIAKNQMNDFGGMISYIPRGADHATAIQIVEKMEVFTLAESLGGVESLAGHPASMTHASIPKEEREKSGVVDGLIRLSVGIEDAKDLIEDLEEAIG